MSENIIAESQDLSILPVNLFSDMLLIFKKYFIY